MEIVLKGSSQKVRGNTEFEHLEQDQMFLMDPLLEMPQQPQVHKARSCRICFEGEATGSLISPCKCDGSIALVHVTCLDDWRTASANPSAFLQVK